MLIKKRKSYNSAPLRIPITQDMAKQFANYTDATGDFIEGGVTQSSEFTTSYTDTEIREMLANPEDNLKEISDLLYYNYISGGVIYQLYTVYKSLPSLNYKIGAFDNSTKKYELSISEVNKMLHKVRYKEVTRDIIGQSALDGGVVCMWCGAKSNLFLYVFDSLEYVFPKYRLNGEWVCVVDLELLKNMPDEERLNLFANLSPYVTESMFNQYESDSSNVEKRYIVLPQERTVYIRNGDYLRRNQRVGIPLGTQALLDINHKQQLKNLEKSISNRAIKNIAVLQVGSDKEGKSYLDIGSKARRQIVSGVGRALKQNATTEATQVPLATIPEFCKLEFNKTDGMEALGSDKYASIEEDLLSDTGISASLTNGTGSNNAGATINLNYLYKRIGVILEQIDSLFDKMIKLILGKKEAENLYFEFEKNRPMSIEKEVELLYQLEAQGYSVKAIIDRISDINFDDYIEQSLYELQDLKLREEIIPPLSSYTMSDKTLQSVTEDSDDTDDTDDTSDSKEDTKKDSKEDTQEETQEETVEEESGDDNE